MAQGLPVHGDAHPEFADVEIRSAPVAEPHPVGPGRRRDGDRDRTGGFVVESVGEVERAGQRDAGERGGDHDEQRDADRR